MQFERETAELVEASEAAIVGMTDLVNELLEFARIDADEGNFIDVDLETVFYQAYVQLRPAIKDAQAEVTHDPLPTVRGKPIQLRQLLHNLIGNTIKFSPSVLDSVGSTRTAITPAGCRVDAQTRVLIHTL